MFESMTYNHKNSNWSYQNITGFKWIINILNLIVKIYIFNFGEIYEKIKWLIFKSKELINNLKLVYFSFFK